MRERIERRRAIERVARQRGALPPRRTANRRTVTITGHAGHGGAEITEGWDQQALAAVATDDLPTWPGSRAQPGSGPAARDRAEARTPGRRRPQRTTTEWLGSSPDRIAAWAVALGFLLVVAALLSPH